jgi:hypothetical protein
VGCSRDIRLGSLPDGPVAQIDAPSPFTSGSYSISFLDPIQTQCMGALAGHEVDFNVITRASLNLVDGQVTLSGAGNQLEIAGTTIQSAFGQPSLVLVPDPMAQPASLWDVSKTGSFGAGPDSTNAKDLAFAVDSATAHDQAGIQGAYARAYESMDGMSVCSVTFGSLLVRN